MKQLRSSRRLIKILQRREKATIDHVADQVGDAEPAPRTSHSPFTASGLAVEEQIRKSWQPGYGGLPVF